MVSAAERLASNFDLSVIGKAKELKSRLWFVICALIVARIGAYIPIPGINMQIIADNFKNHAGGVFGVFNMFSGGSLFRMSIFALGIMPYISSSIIIQLMTIASPHLATLKKEGEAGRRKINQYTRYGTVALAFVQGYGISNWLESMHSAGGMSAALDPGLFFKITTALTLMGGTMFLVWLGEQITARGIGNGTSLIIFAGIVAGFPAAIARTLEQGRTGALPTEAIIGILAGALALVAFIVFIERAQRRIIVQYPKRQVGLKIMGGDSSHLPLKLNMAGVIPPIFASSILLFPLTLAGFSQGKGPSWITTVTAYLGHGQPLYIMLYMAIIIFFSFFYTSVVFNTTDTADNLKKYGGFIAGIRPGKNTAEYLDYVVTRLTTVGALYLAFVCAVPEILIANYNIPFYLGGTSILISINVLMDFVAQVQSHLFAHQYEGLIKKAKLKGKGK
jgi:preprotein translocase subunit SecY